MAKPKLNAKEEAQMKVLRARAKELAAKGMAPVKAMIQAIDEETAKARDELESVREQAGIKPPPKTWRPETGSIYE